MPFATLFRTKNIHTKPMASNPPFFEKSFTTLLRGRRKFETSRFVVFFFPRLTYRIWRYVGKSKVPFVFLAAG